MDAKTLRSYGLSLLFLAMALGGIGRSIHSSSINMAMNGASILCSIAGIALFVKAAPPKRRPIILVSVTVGVVAAALIAYLVINR